MRKNLPSACSQQSGLAKIDGPRKNLLKGLRDAFLMGCQSTSAALRPYITLTQIRGQSVVTWSLVDVLKEDTSWQINRTVFPTVPRKWNVKSSSKVIVPQIEYRWCFATCTSNPRRHREPTSQTLDLLLLVFSDGTELHGSVSCPKACVQSAH